MVRDPSYVPAESVTVCPAVPESFWRITSSLPAAGAAMVMAQAGVVLFSVTKDTSAAMAPDARYVVSDRVSLVRAGGVANRLAMEIAFCRELPRYTLIKSEETGTVMTWLVGTTCFAEG